MNDKLSQLFNAEKTYSIDQLLCVTRVGELWGDHAFKGPIKVIEVRFNYDGGDCELI